MNNIAQLKETPHWSYSAFQTFLTCPLKYQFRYIDKVEPETNVKAVIREIQCVDNYIINSDFNNIYQFW